MEKQILLNEENYNNIDYNKNRFILLDKEEQTEIMRRKLSLILEQCEEISQKLNDEKHFLEKPKH